MRRRWLKDWAWETVVTINAGLCQEKNALHKPTSGAPIWSAEWVTGEWMRGEWVRTFEWVDFGMRLKAGEK